MKITVFGAAGNVGSRVVAEALARGHDVTAVARNPSGFDKLNALATPRAGNAGNVADVIRLSARQDVLIGATRPASGRENEVVAVTETLLAALAGTGVRLLLVGGAGSLTVPGSGGVSVSDDPSFVPPDVRPIALAGIDQLKVCRAETTADWTYLSPAALMEPGQRTGSYRVGGDELLVDADGSSTISMEDLAVALLDETEQPRHQGTRFTVAY